ncbi:unnamed protein product [Rhizopus stolonifer]
MTSRRSAWTIVLTSSNDYVKGIVTMKYAMRNSQYPLLILYTPNVSLETIKLLQNSGCLVKQIEPIHPPGKTNYTFERFTETWSKLAVWSQTEYERLVLLDADMLPLQNMDELIEMDLPKGWIAASHACTCNPQKFSHYPPHWIPASCAYTQSPAKTAYFNSGLVVLSPDTAKFKSMMDDLNAVQDLSIYPFPDQDFLNEQFKDQWKPLPYVYNALKTLQWAHEPMWNLKSVKNLHYILTKPWDICLGQELSSVELVYKDLYQIWWDHYNQAQE